MVDLQEQGWAALD
uniref:Uncharacterized protein n=1 Tax=Anguilla anguilla TaxID=7936 RepID=A0A0E9V2G3_ANGAN